MALGDPYEPSSLMIEEQKIEYILAIIVALKIFLKGKKRKKVRKKERKKRKKINERKKEEKHTSSRVLKGINPIRGIALPG